MHIWNRASWSGKAGQQSGGQKTLEDGPEHRLDFMHYEWLSRQYELIGELLQRFPCPHTAVMGGVAGSGAPDLDCYADPDHYFFNAAL